MPATLGRPAVPVPLGAALFADLEATNATTGDVETVEIGPIFGRYLTLSAPDLLVALDALKRLADEAQVAVMDARQEALEAELQSCPYCGTPSSVEPGEDHCRSVDCGRRFAAEVYADSVMGGI